MSIKVKILVGLFFGIVSLIAFWEYFYIFIPADNAGQIYFFQQGNILCMENKNKNASPHFVSFPFMFLFFKLFGTNSVCWIGLSFFLHVINSFLVVVVSSKLLQLNLSERSLTISFFTGLIFLLSPYQSETVLWAPTNIPVLLSTFLFLLAVHFLIKHLICNHITYLIVAHTAFLLSAFSYESSFVLPAVMILLFFLLKKDVTITFQQFFGKITFPQIIVITIYLLTTKMVFGSWLWHGGEIDILKSFSEFAGNFLKYLLKFFFFFRYFIPNEIHSFLRNLYHNKQLVVLIFIMIITIFLLILYVSIRFQNKKVIFTAIVFACFSVSLVPVLGLDTSFVRYAYPDRYGYLPSLFFYFFLVVIPFFLLRKAALPIVVIYVGLCFVLLLQTNQKWKAANEYCKHLIEEIKNFSQHQRIYVLDAAAYYYGIPAFRSGFSYAVNLKYGWAIDKIKFIAGSYHDSPSDSIVSVTISQNTINVIGKQKITPYFSTDGGWAKSYETDEYRVAFNERGNSYTIYFKDEIPSNSAFIYALPVFWKKANRTQ